VHTHMRHWENFEGYFFSLTTVQTRYEKGQAVSPSQVDRPYASTHESVTEVE
jgi:hypothetical protein